MTQDGRFEEKILMRTRQHWIVLVIGSVKLVLYFALPLGFFAYLLSGWSFGWALWIFLIMTSLVILYDHYLWHHSWLLIGNQKITLSVRNGIFSQYAMNIRYRNIRDSAVSKKSIVGYLLKFWTLFVRSSTNEWDFQAHYVPKVGKVYAIVNALSRYTDDERSKIHSIEELYAFHQAKEFSHLKKQKTNTTIEEGLAILRALPGITDVIELSSDSRKYIRAHEEIRNNGVLETITRDHVVVFLHNHLFRDPADTIVKKNASDEVYFPWVPFPEIEGKRVLSASPWESIHSYLVQFFPYHEKDDATVLVGWDD
jgi:hypothetical protein